MQQLFTQNYCKCIYKTILDSRQTDFVTRFNGGFCTCLKSDLVQTLARLEEVWILVTKGLG